MKSKKPARDIQLRSTGYVGTQHLQDAAILHSFAVCFEFQSAPNYATNFVAVRPNEPQSHRGTEATWINNFVVKYFTPVGFDHVYF